jgi:hypothetical protein
LGVVTKLDEQLGLVCFEHGEALGGVLALLELAELLPDAWARCLAEWRADPR